MMEVKEAKVERPWIQSKIQTDYLLSLPPYKSNKVSIENHPVRTRRITFGPPQKDKVVSLTEAEGSKVEMP